MSIVVIGKSSFTAQAIQEKWPHLNWVWLTHQDAISRVDWLDEATTVINFAFAPEMRTAAYDAEFDIDRRIARRIADRSAHYIMASSRMVYGTGPEKFGLTEETPLFPTTPYGRNKAAIEKSLCSILPEDRLTILRSSNIFGHELDREMFFGRLLTRLKNEKEIIYDMSPDSCRDFLAVWHQTDAIKMIAENPAAGIFNLGAGFGTPCGKIAEWVMEGYGEGRLTVTNDSMADQFWLDTTKLHTKYPALPHSTPDILRQDCVECGRWLRSQ